MLRQCNEFALHEFGSFEFGLESLAQATLASFEGAGLGDVKGQSQVYAFSVVGVEGLTSPFIHGTAITNSIAKGEGKTSLSPFAVLVRGGRFAAYGDAYLDLRSGRGVGGSFAAEGLSELTFYYFEGHEFHIRPKSAMEIFAWATANLESFIEGVTHTEMVGGSFQYSELDSQSVSAVQGVGGSFNLGTYSVRSEAQVRGRLQRVATSHTDIAGITSATPRIQMVVNRRFSAEGEAGIIVPSAPLYKRDTQIQIHGQASLNALSQFKQFHDLGFAHHGSTQFLAYGQQVIGMVVETHGTSHVIWWRGRNTLPFLDPAYVRFVRPEELRTLVWRE